MDVTQLRNADGGIMTNEILYTFIIAFTYINLYILSVYYNLETQLLSSNWFTFIWVIISMICMIILINIWVEEPQYNKGYKQ